MSPSALGEELSVPNTERRCEMFRALSPIVPRICIELGTVRNSNGEARLRVGPQRSAVRNDAAVHDVVKQAKPSPGYLVLEEVQFEFDSDRLRPSARSVLDDLASVISHRINQKVRFLIEGHADAVGDTDYNQKLSERRAASVVRYLADVHGVDGERLSAVGMGERALVDLQTPGGSRNRRVSIKTVMP